MTRSATGLLPPLEHRPVGRGELVTREPLRNVGARELSGEPVRPAVGDTRDLVGHLPGQIRGTPGELCSLSSSKKKRTSLEPDRPPCTRVQGDRDLGVAVGVDGLCSDESLSLIPVVARLPTTSRGRHISPSIGESRPRRWLRSRLGTPPRSGPPALFRGCPGLSPARSAIVNDGFTATWGHSHRRQYLRGGQWTIHIQSTASTEGEPLRARATTAAPSVAHPRGDNVASRGKKSTYAVDLPVARPLSGAVYRALTRARWPTWVPHLDRRSQQRTQNSTLLTSTSLSSRRYDH